MFGRCSGEHTPNERVVFAYPDPTRPDPGLSMRKSLLLLMPI